MKVESRKIKKYNVEISRKNIKNIHLYISPPYGNINISVPKDVKNETIDLFIISKSYEIDNAIKNFHNTHYLKKREYVDGESFYYFGKNCKIKLNESIDRYISIDGNVANIYIKNIESFDEKSKLVKKWQKEELYPIIDKFITKYEKKLNVKIHKYIIREMKTQWGSCNEKDKILVFNRELIGKPIRCIEYIVLHELAHLIEHKHNSDFEKILEKYMEDWKDRRKELNEFPMIEVG